MRKIFAIQGWPGSGKTTLAQQWLARDPEHRSRVSRDDLRQSLFNSEGILSPDQESVVTKVLNAQIVALLKSNKDILIDATNLNAKFLKQLLAFCQKNGALSFETLRVETPVDNCVLRDKKRFEAGGCGVGEAAIRGLAKRFPQKNWPTINWVAGEDIATKQYVPNPKLPKTVTCDIDGTVANLVGVRGPYDTSRYHLDETHPEIIELLQVLHDSEQFDIVFLSGRSEDFYDVTWEWLVKHLGFAPTNLIMRKSGDMRNDAIIKPELFWEQVAPNYNVVLHIDDRQRVVDALRAINVPVLQCRPGDF